MSDFEETTGASRPREIGAPLSEFFIVGCPRSGTSLLRFLLDAHPDIAVTPETHFADRHLRIAAGSRAERSLGSAHGSRVGDAAAAREAIVDSFCASDGFRRMPIDEEAFREAARSALDDAWWPLRIAMHEFATRRGVAIVGEKTPGHALHWRALSTAFPRARFLLVLRDPRAVAASWSRTSWSEETTTEIGEKWRRHFRAMCDAERSLSGRCLEVRYEELVADPSAVLARVCSFLGTHFDRRMLRFHERARDPDAKDVPPDEGIDNPRTFRPIDPTRADAWRQELAFRDRCRVEIACGRSMSEAGYPPETPFRRRLAQSLATSPRLLGRRLRRSLRELDGPDFVSTR